ncbi:MAG TPA: galactokinase [Bryobacteraceae bacterium]|nr:galactokinase [Bryobacteraceae bacterium]
MNTASEQGAQRVFEAPGRVNLIGEFTDFNEGFVLPAAIERSVQATVTSRHDRRLHIRSEGFEDTADFDLDDPEPQAAGHWSDYPRGVAVELQRAGYRLNGANLSIRSTVPIGAGLSSSAAVEVATAAALCAISEISLGHRELALLCQRAENNFVGMRCGIMDQFISCHGEAGYAIMLDCRSLEYRQFPVPPGIQLVICNSMVRHALAGGEYNQRREDCEAGVRALALSGRPVRALRDATLADLDRAASTMPERVYRRCRHVIAENLRVQRAGEAMLDGDLETLGGLMAESHQSLRDDFEVSCPELDLLVGLAVSTPGIRGARMTGGGFGGCTINLVEEEAVASFICAVSAKYSKDTGVVPEIYVTGAAAGVHEDLQ